MRGAERRDHLGATVKLGHDEFDVTQRFGGRESTVCRVSDAVDECITRLIDRHLAPNDTGNIDVDVLWHESDGPRITRDLDDRHDRVTDHVTLPCREDMNDVAGGSL